MRLWLVTLHILLVGSNLWASAHFHEDLEDNEFAEFEDFDDDHRPHPHHKPKPPSSSPSSSVTPVPSPSEELFEEDDALVEDDVDLEFDHFQDEEEFEGLESNPRSGNSKPDEPSTLTITKVPLHLRARWDSFYLEILMVTGLFVYFINYLAGRSKNLRICEKWLQDNKKILQENFSLVGDTATSTEDDDNGLVKESESQYEIYCSGRVGCESMMIELRLIKRQDLVAVLSQIVKPQNDQVHLKIELSTEESHNFVLAIATKKTAMHLTKDIADIATYCPEKRPGEKFGLPGGLFVMSEIAEATSAILDATVLQAINKYAHMVDYIHISDQFSGAKQQEDGGQLTMPDVKRVLLIGFNISIKGKLLAGENQEKMRQLLQLSFYLLDKLRRIKLSKEGQTKASKNRFRVEEAFLKSTHAARAEALAQKREEKRQKEKDKILQEEDPDKQRRWEEKEQKRLAKKRAPRMKQLKVKAL